MEGAHLETKLSEQCTPEMFPSSGFSERSSPSHSSAEDKSPFFLAKTNEKVGGRRLVLNVSISL